MGWAFDGGFFGPLQARSWQDRFASQANPESLEQSGDSIILASLYAHPLFSLSLRDSIRRQIRRARQFVQSHPRWMIATDPAQAEAALHSGQKVLILHLEGAAGILETEEDLREFVDEGGIRIVGPLHLMDDQFGGVAFLRGWRVLSDPWAWFKQLFAPEFSDEVRINPAGLTDIGLELARKLISHHVWIDLAHASDHSMQQLVSLMNQVHQPLLYTHSSLRRFHLAERGISKSQLEQIAQSGGILGLMPSEQMLEDAAKSPECPSALSALASEYQEASHVISPDHLMLGSDINGGIPHLKPGCNTGTVLDKEGFWNIGQKSALWESLRNLKAHTAEPLSKMADTFIATWKKAYLAHLN